MDFFQVELFEIPYLFVHDVYFVAFWSHWLLKLKNLPVLIKEFRLILAQFGLKLIVIWRLSIHIKFYCLKLIMSDLKEMVLLRDYTVKVNNMLLELFCLLVFGYFWIHLFCFHQLILFILIDFSLLQESNTRPQIANFFLWCYLCRRDWSWTWGGSLQRCVFFALLISFFRFRPLSQWACVVICCSLGK